MWSSTVVLALLLFPLPLLEEVGSLETESALFVAGRMIPATKCALGFTLMVFGRGFSAADFADLFVGCWADVRAMAEPAAPVAHFVPLLVYEAAVFGAVAVNIVRYLGAFEDDDCRICPAHSSCLQNRGILLIDKASCDILSTVVFGDVVYNPLDGVLGRRRISGDVVGFFSEAELLDGGVFARKLHAGGAGHDDVFCGVDSKEIFRRFVVAETGRTEHSIAQLGVADLSDVEPLSRAQHDLYVFLGQGRLTRQARLPTCLLLGT